MVLDGTELDSANGARTCNSIDSNSLVEIRDKVGRMIIRQIIRLLTFLEIIPLKLFLRQWIWLLDKLDLI